MNVLTGLAVGFGPSSPSHELHVGFTPRILSPGTWVPRYVRRGGRIKRCAPNIPKIGRGASSPERTHGGENFFRAFTVTDEAIFMAAHHEQRRPGHGPGSKQLLHLN